MQRSQQRGQAFELGNNDGPFVTESLSDEFDSEGARWPVPTIPLARWPPASRVPRANVIIRRCGPQDSVERLHNAVCGLAGHSGTVALQILPCPAEQVRDRLVNLAQAFVQVPSNRKSPPLSGEQYVRLDAAYTYVPHTLAPPPAEQNVSGPDYGSDMYTRLAGANGRYQRKCEQGHCALTGGQATSRHEGELLTLLKYVISHGRGDVRAFIGRWQFRLDMVFNLPNGRVLVAEYDGAYWHGGHDEIEKRRHHEGRDYCKARNIEAAWRDRGCVVVRIREDPLEPLHEHDIQVPARSDPDVCARITLIHLVHVMHPDFLESLGEDKVISFLRSAGRPLVSGDLRCDTCLEVASYYLPNEISREQSENLDLMEAGHVS